MAPRSPRHRSASRSAFDLVYRCSAALAGLAFVSIAALVVLQVVSRIAGFHLAGLVDYATYAMVAALFLGIGPALRRGSHVRVTLVLGVVPPKLRRAMELGCLAIGTGLMTCFAWYAVGLALNSWRFGLREMGLAATPLWIPQSAMALGGTVAAIAFADDLVAVAAGRPPSYATTEGASLASEATGDEAEDGGRWTQ